MKLDFKGFTKDQLTAFADTVGTQTSRFFKVSDGTSKVRLFVSPNEPEPAPFFPTYQHWLTGSDGKKYSILCTHRTPGIHNRPCPVCAKIAEFYDSDNAEMVRVAKESKPNLSFLQWGFVKGPKDTDWRPDPAVVSLPRTVVTMITEICTMEDEYVDTYSYDSGKFLTLNRKKDGGIRYVYTVLPSNSPFPINTSPWVEKIEATAAILSTMEVPTEEDQRKAVADLENSVGATVEEVTEEEEFGTSVRQQLGSFSDVLNS